MEPVGFAGPGAAHTGSAFGSRGAPCAGRRPSRTWAIPREPRPCCTVPGPHDGVLEHLDVPLGTVGLGKPPASRTSSPLRKAKTLVSRNPEPQGGIPVRIRRLTGKRPSIPVSRVRGWPRERRGRDDRWGLVHSGRSDAMGSAEPRLLHGSLRRSPSRRGWVFLLSNAAGIRRSTGSTRRVRLRSVQGNVGRVDP